MYGLLGLLGVLLMVRRQAPSAYIVLDPGHGGQDPGAVAPDGTREADLNLAQALTLIHISEPTRPY